jgi:hypothetical protein
MSHVGGIPTTVLVLTVLLIIVLLWLFLDYLLRRSSGVNCFLGWGRGHRLCGLSYGYVWGRSSCGCLSSSSGGGGSWIFLDCNGCCIGWFITVAVSNESLTITLSKPRVDFGRQTTVDGWMEHIQVGEEVIIVLIVGRVHRDVDVGYATV